MWTVCFGAALSCPLLREERTPSSHPGAPTKPHSPCFKDLLVLPFFMTMIFWKSPLWATPHAVTTRLLEARLLRVWTWPSSIVGFMRSHGCSCNQAYFLDIAVPQCAVEAGKGARQSEVKGRKGFPRSHLN